MISEWIGNNWEIGDRLLSSIRRIETPRQFTMLNPDSMVIDYYPA